MFNADFYPTPDEVIEMMLQGENIEGKVILEPSAGKGNIIDWLKLNGAKDVIACELNQDLKKIVQTKCNVIADDFLTVTSDRVSHIDMIIMNPPFSADEKHILHAFEIAPAGCRVIALCNSKSLNTYGYRVREQLLSTIEAYGTSFSLGSVFSKAERETDVDVSVIKLQKPGENYSQEFEGFFLEEDPEEQQENSIMTYNFIRDLVNRYVAAIKIFDQQLDTAVRLNDLTSSFFNTKLGFECTMESRPVKRNEYKKDLQKAAWNYIFSKMNMQKHATKGLREDINKFVEQQQQIPFTMRNIYRMIEIVIGTTEQRMDKALLEVFDRVTEHYDENRFNVEGWKTNSHYLLTEKFILPYLTRIGWSGEPEADWHGRCEMVEDMQKALCYITGMNYDECTTFSDFLRQMKCSWGTWYCWGFFEIKCFKKGTTHFKFQDKDLWARFNQRVAKLKGYPLYEPKKQNEYEQKQTGRAQQDKSNFRKWQDNQESIFAA